MDILKLQIDILRSVHGKRDKYKLCKVNPGDSHIGIMNEHNLWLIPKDEFYISLDLEKERLVEFETSYEKFINPSYECLAANRTNEIREVEIEIKKKGTKKFEKITVVKIESVCGKSSAWVNIKNLAFYDQEKMKFELREGVFPINILYGDECVGVVMPVRISE